MPMKMKSGVHFKSASDRWETPKAVYDSLDQEFHFNFDPCPLDETDKLDNPYERDGLATLYVSWAGKRVFCNPPYGPRTGEWLARASEAELAVFLIPARTDTKWFHDIVLPKASEIRFLRGRLKFGGATAPAPFPSMIVVFHKKKEASD